MSIWTHIAGNIRIDALAFLGTKFVDELKVNIGSSCSFSDETEVWDKCTVPTGSEGSVQYKIISYGEPTHLAWGSVQVWGDLRDFDSPQEIFDWVQRICSGIEYSVRQCAVFVEVEDAGRYFIYLDSEAERGSRGEQVVKMVELK